MENFTSQILKINRNGVEIEKINNDAKNINFLSDLEIKLSDTANWKIDENNVPYIEVDIEWDCQQPFCNLTHHEFKENVKNILNKINVSHFHIKYSESMICSYYTIYLRKLRMFDSMLLIFYKYLGCSNYYTHERYV